MSDLLSSHTITITSYGPGGFTNGEWVQGAEIKFEIQANVQPAPRALLNLPEGQRTKGSITVFVKEKLVTVNKVTLTTADRIEYEGRTYEIQHVEDWINCGSLSHYEITAVETDKKEADRKP